MSTMRSWVVQSFAFDLDRQLTTNFVEHLARLPLTFFLRRRPGELLRRAADSAALRAFLSGRAFAVCIDALMVVGFAAMLIYYHPLLGCFIVLLGAVRVAWARRASGRLAQPTALELEAAGKETTALIESVVRFEAVKALRLETWLLSRIREQTARRLSNAVSRQKIALYAGCFNVVLDGLGTAALLVVGGAELLAGTLSLGTFTALVALRALFSSPLESLLRTLPDLQLLRQQIAQIDDVLDEPTERSGAAPLPTGDATLELQNVSFRYGDYNPWILRDVSLSVAPGESLLIVGLAGAGKSTLGRLVAGLLEPTRGAVCLNGQSLGSYQRQGVRRRVIMTPQSPHLFDASIRENLQFGGPGASDEQLWGMLEIACLDEVVQSLPLGLDARIGPGGVSLSKGQRQRLALARALLARPAILVLDEFGSGLDRETERRIQEKLGTIGCTKIFISHRFAALPRLDRIVMVDGAQLRCLPSTVGARDLPQVLAAAAR
jgi:ABC-type bacteriocin/lantibiotic exporter with double-glycine peptidase domain